MSELTLDGLLRFLHESAGSGDGVDLSGDILDTDFEALGYDSLALLETVGAIQREYGTVLADNADLRTPRDLLKHANQAIADAR